MLVAVGAIMFLWPRDRAFIIEPNADQNVLLVTIDTLRADALSSYGGRAQTPNLDRLASGGARFTFAHAHAVVTLPSHTSILTGRLPYEHGMRDNSGFRVKDGTATLATRLKAAGLATGAFVGGFPLTKRFGLTPGFDVYDDQIPELEGDISFTMPERRADEVVSRAVDWIGKTSTRFFTWVHVFDPHSPYKPPGELATTYAGQPYYGEVAFVDRALGPLFDRLATLSRPTLVIVTADHGESLGEHGEMTHGMFAYEATLRVPLIVARIEPGSGRPSKGIVIDTPARHVDIAPTVLEAVGVAADGPFAGTSLKEVVRTGRGDDRPAYFESMTYNLVRGWAPLRGVLVKKDKYVDQPIPEMYDLAGDPNEERNLAPQQAERVQVLVNVLRTFNVAPPDRPGQESADGCGHAALARLRVRQRAGAQGLHRGGRSEEPRSCRPRPAHGVGALPGWQGPGRDRAPQRRDRSPTRYRGRLYLPGARLLGVRPTAAGHLNTRESAGQPRAGSRRAHPPRDLPRGEPDRSRARHQAAGRPAGQRCRSAERPRRGLRRRWPIRGGHSGIQESARARPHQRPRVPEPGGDGAQAGAGSKSDSDRRSRLQEAERYARQALDADPSLPKAYTTLGVILAESGRKREAIDSWKRAVALDGREFDALYNLTILLLEARQTDDARAYAKQFVATAPPALYAPAIEQMRKFLGNP